MSCGNFVGCTCERIFDHTSINAFVHYNNSEHLDLVTNTACVGKIGLVRLFDTETSRSLPSTLTSNGDSFNVTLQGTGFFDDDTAGEGTYQLCFSTDDANCNCNCSEAFVTSTYSFHT